MAFEDPMIDGRRGKWDWTEKVLWGGEKDIQLFYVEMRYTLTLCILPSSPRHRFEYHQRSLNHSSTLESLFALPKGKEDLSQKALKLRPRVSGSERSHCISEKRPTRSTDLPRDPERGDRRSSPSISTIRDWKR